MTDNIPGFQPFRARAEWRDEPHPLPECSAPLVRQSPLCDAEDRLHPTEAEQRREAAGSARGLVHSVLWGLVCLAALIACGVAFGSGYGR